MIHRSTTRLAAAGAGHARHLTFRAAPSVVAALLLEANTLSVRLSGPALLERVWRDVRRQRRSDPVPRLA